MARVHATIQFGLDRIDWNGDQASTFSPANQDVNFDNALPGQLNGYDDPGQHPVLDRSWRQEPTDTRKSSPTAPDTGRWHLLIWGEGFEDQADGYEVSSRQALRIRLTASRIRPMATKI